MMKWKLWLGGVLMAGLSTTAVHAQQGDQDPRKEIEQLRKRLDELERKMQDQEKKVQEQGKKLDDPKTPAGWTPPDWLTRIKLEGIAFARYSREMEDSAKDYNEFDLDRIYLILWSQLWDKGKVRYTLEGGDLRESGTDQFDLSTKHFYLEVQDLLIQGDYVRIGQADLPWVSFEESLWNYRFQGTVFPDRSGYLTSTDLGISYGGKFPDGYGSWHASVVNGEGWKKNEIGKHKDAHLRVTLNPLARNEGPWKNLFVSGFGSVGRYEHDSDLTGGEPTDRERMIVQAGYKEPDAVTLIAEYLWAEDPTDKLKSRHPSLAGRPNEDADARGYSIYGTVNAGFLGILSDKEMAKKWEAIARWDHLDPDDDISKNDLDRGILGVAYRWNKHVRTLLNWERVDFETRSLKQDESRMQIQMEVKF